MPFLPTPTTCRRRQLPRRISGDQTRRAKVSCTSIPMHRRMLFSRRHTIVGDHSALDRRTLRPLTSETMYSHGETLLRAISLRILKLSRSRIQRQRASDHPLNLALPHAGTSDRPPSTQILSEAHRTVVVCLRQETMAIIRFEEFDLQASVTQAAYRSHSRVQPSARPCL